MSCENGWPPGFPYPSDPWVAPCWWRCQPIPPGILAQRVPAAQREAVTDPRQGPVYEQRPGAYPSEAILQAVQAPAGQAQVPWPFGMPPIDLTIGEKAPEQTSTLTKILLGALPIVVGGVAVYYLTRGKPTTQRKSKAARGG